jgi:hypothetical protein
MDAQSVDRVSKQVIQRFPGLKGSHPSIQSYGEGKFLLIFNGSAQTADGKTIHQTVRVVAEADGKVIKMTASR